VATSAPTSPDGSNELNLVDGLVQLSFLVQHALAEAGDGAGLTTVQLRLLGILRDREPAMREIAGYMGLDKSSVSGLVDRAEQRGLVRRIASTDDGRSFRVALTPQGKKLATALTRDVSRRISALTDGLSTTETERLTTLAGRLVTDARGKRG
jgi:DNA-binding MarR family transcriptional regulator